MVLLLGKQAKTKSQILLLALAFAITIGSVISPIGNPQNLLIAVSSEVANPFVTFFRYLLIPTMINLLVAYAMLRLFYQKYFTKNEVVQYPEPIRDPKLSRLAQVSLGLMVFLILVKIILVFTGNNIDFRLTYIAIAAALPIIVFSPRRLTVIKRIDWSTLVFFAAMFVLMQSVWNAGVVQSYISGTSLNLTSGFLILLVSIVLSQFISNVPLVALYLPVLMKMGVSPKQLMALAAGSTIAGNLSVLGAASNVIIIQNAEQKSGETLSFLEFIRIGIPLTVVNALVYWVYFTVF